MEPPKLWNSLAEVRTALLEAAFPDTDFSNGPHEPHRQEWTVDTLLDTLPLRICLCWRIGTVLPHLPLV